MKIFAALFFAKRLVFPRAGKNLASHRSLVASAICVGVSLVPLVVVLSVCDGMIKGITERTISISSSHARCFLNPLSNEAKSQQNFLEFSERIKKIEGVSESFAEIQGIALASAKNGRTGAAIRAIEPKIFSSKTKFASFLELKEGNLDFFAKNENPSQNSQNQNAKIAIIGEKLAQTLNLHVGDDFRIITARQMPNGKIFPRIVRFVVGGVVSCGYQELDALWVFIPLEEGFSLLAGTSAQYQVGVEVFDPYSYEIYDVAKKINQILPAHSFCATWNELNEAQFENLSSTRLMLVLIMTLIVLVAATNIASALVMLVTERRREIALLKSLGAKNWEIAFSFLTAGFAAGLAGVIFGIPVGALCALNFNKITNFVEKILNSILKFVFLLQNNALNEYNEIHLLDSAYYLQNAEISILPLQILMVAVGAIFLSLVMSFFPSLKAGAEKPIKTLRA